MTLARRRIGAASERDKEIFDAVKNSDVTFQAIADKYALTRERVRQIAERSGVTGAERIAKKNVEKEFELRRGMYPEHVAATWKEAVSRGHDVKGFIDRRRLRKNILFINRRMVVVYHATSAHRTAPHGPLYGHVSLRREAAHVVVVDNPLNGTRTFYVLPRKFCRRKGALYIPLATLRKGKSRFEQYREAWQLLGDTTQSNNG